MDNFMNKITIILLVLLVGAAAQGVAWNDIFTGKITPVTSFSGNATSSSYSYSIPHSAPATPVLACIALISYDAILTTTFTFNSTIVSVNATSVEVSIQTYSTTYFRTLSYHYLITSHATIQIINLCYYTSSLFTGSGDRNQTFNNATTALSGSLLQTVTVFTGMKMSNTNGQYYYIKAESNQSTLPTITTIFSTQEDNLVEWACVAVVIYDAKSTIVGEFYFRDSSIVGNSIGLSLVTSIDPAYQLLNTMFFGLSHLQMSLVFASSQKFIIDSGSTTPLASPIINQNQIVLLLEQLYFWTDSCISNTSNYVPVSGVTCASNCTDGYYPNANQYCVACSITTGYCLTCSGSQCTSCDSSSPTFRTLDTGVTPNVCVCMTGYFDLSGNCTLCSSYLDHCTDCTSQSNCIACSTNYTATGGVCVCNPGTYPVNASTCSPLIGCLTYNNITSGYYCIDCDTDNYFYKLANQTCECQANTIYNTTTGKCQGNCSDGVSLGNECDLGPLNGVAGSGCASNCTVVYGYYCSNPSTTSASTCVNTTNYTGQYLYATRDLSSNTANIYVRLSPIDAYLSQMDFSSLITTSFKTKSLTTTFDNSTGILLIKAEYSESIEGTQQMLNISFDSTKIYSPSVVLYQTIQGINARLDYGSFEAYNSIIYYLSMFVGGLALLLGVLSGVLGYKLIGFEICLPLQVTYFTLLLLNVPQASLASLYGLDLSSGYNKLQSFNLLQNQYLDKGLIVLQRNNNFLENCNYSYVPLAVLLILTAVTGIWVKEKVEEPLKKVKSELKKKKKEEQKQQAPPEEAKLQQEVGNCEKAHFFILDKLLVNYWVLLLLNSVFSFGLQLQTSSTGGKFGPTANIAVGGVMMTVALAGLVFIALKIKEKAKSITFRSHSMYYPIFYIGTQLVAVILIVSSYYTTALAIFGILVPQIVVLFWLIRLAPHGKFKSFNFIVGLYIQIVALLSTVIFIGNNYSSSPSIATVSAFIILALYLVGEGLTIARLVIRYRQDKAKALQKNSEDKVKLQAQNLQAMTYSSIKNQLMNNSKQKMNWQGINQGKADGKNTPNRSAQYQQLDSREDSEDEKENDEDELKRLKRRLRKEIFQKRNLDL